MDGRCDRSPPARALANRSASQRIAVPLLYPDPEIAGLSNRNLYSPGAPHWGVVGSGVPPSAQPNILLQTPADCRMDTRPELDPVPGTHRHVAAGTLVMAEVGVPGEQPDARSSMDALRFLRPGCW
ncbi:uncharacterized protein BKCO1_4600073 [Diplodia corticola]|uniref:Uncharacterized protein n=1 Tax=Diplodia corticola TaxID=236234 RepID=A0A1J9RUY1_9PEZI|nr:uncharacterized protein BKCO1_4600073 [Diplodia corticola]OJD31652.1 hypothetical protein BKCO1_4600073 [Diplodia corticola]